MIRCCRSSDVFLLPSAQESFGLAALEAMACEVPVVASNVGGLPEVIEHGVTGFLHDQDDLDGMAASAMRLLTDPALHRAGRARRPAGVVAARFCTDVVVPRVRGHLHRPGAARGRPRLNAAPGRHRRTRTAAGRTRTSKD